MNNQNFNNIFDVDTLIEKISDRVVEKLEQRKLNKDDEPIFYDGTTAANMVGLSYPQFRKNFVEGKYNEAIFQVGSKYCIDKDKVRGLNPRKKVKP